MKNCYLICLVIGWGLLACQTCYAQENGWELGLGIQPRGKLETHHFLMAKKRLSEGLKLRSGLSMNFVEGTDRKRYGRSHGINSDTSLFYQFLSENTVTTKYMEIGYFIGLQYGWRTGILSFYGATDLKLGYSDFSQSDFLDNLLQNGHLLLDQVFDTGSYLETKTRSLGAGQSIGIEVQILPILTLSIECGLSYLANFVSVAREEYLYHGTVVLIGGQDPHNFFGGILLPKRKVRTHDFNVSLLNLISVCFKLPSSKAANR